MVIDIEDRHPASAMRGLGRGDRRAVEVAITAQIIAARMVPGWPAQGESDGLRFVEHRGECAQRGLGAPGFSGDRRRRVETVAAQPRVDPIEPQRAPPGHRPGITDRIAASSGFHPVRMRRAQERDIIATMDPQDRLYIMVAHRPMRRKLPQDNFGARGLFGIIGPAAVVQFHRRLVGQLARIEKDRNLVCVCWHAT